ncbi:MAG: hypothetical protein ACOH19_06610 [Rhodoglobus sp.]
MTVKAKHSMRSIIAPADPRDPGDDYLRAELERDRRTERWVAMKAVIALAAVAVLVIIRQVFFE